MNGAYSRMGISQNHIKLAAFFLLGIGFLGLAIPAAIEPLTYWTGIVLGDYIYLSHEFHHFVLASVFTILLLGVIGQVIRPTARVGALHTSIVIWTVISVIFAIGGEFAPIQLLLLALLLGMAITHPAGYRQVPLIESIDRRMIIIGGITAFGGGIIALGELYAHFTASDPHTAFGHYLFMSVTWSSIAILSIYGSFRGIGWRFPVYSVVFFLLVIGIGSIVYPGAEQGSSLGSVFGVVVVSWAILIWVVAERGIEISRL